MEGSRRIEITKGIYRPKRDFLGQKTNALLLAGILLILALAIRLFGGADAFREGLSDFGDGLVGGRDT